MSTTIAVGMKLEAVDRKNPCLLGVATVVEIDTARPHPLRIHFDGWASEYDYWAGADSKDLYPAGYCKSHGIELQRPSALAAAGDTVQGKGGEGGGAATSGGSGGGSGDGSSSSSSSSSSGSGRFSWTNYLSVTKAKPVPKTLLPRSGPGTGFHPRRTVTIPSPPEPPQLSDGESVRKLAYELHEAHFTGGLGMRDVVVQLDAIARELLDEVANGRCLPHAHPPHLTHTSLHLYQAKFCPCSTIGATFDTVTAVQWARIVWRASADLLSKAPLDPAKVWACGRVEDVRTCGRTDVRGALFLYWIQL
jgi:hypothetical protein